MYNAPMWECVGEGVEYLPMFKVTVIMLRDIVESVILENDEA